MLFIIVPLLDLMLLFFLAEYLTWQNTFLIVVASGVLGAWLAAKQGRAVRGRIQEQLRHNQLPTGSLISDGAMILFAAGLLITPALITDLFGLSLLVAPIREWYKRLGKKWFQGRIQFQTFQMPFEPPVQRDPNIVEGQVVDHDNESHPED